MVELRVHSQSGWVFKVTKGTISSITEAETLSKTLGFPIPTMTFPNNSLFIGRVDDQTVYLVMNTKELLLGVSKSLPTDIRLPDSKNQFWMQKSLSLGCALEYDWTFWCESQGKLEGVKDVWQRTEDRINYDLLKSTVEPIQFFESFDFYEDELADNGICRADVRLRVMDLNFFVRLRCFLRVDHVMLRCMETRYYHEFGSKFMLKETKSYQDDYESFKQKNLYLDHNDIDSIVGRMTVTNCFTEKITISV